MPEKKKPKKPRKVRCDTTPYTKEQVEGFIEDSMGSVTQAAANVGVPYSTFYNWMEKYQIKAYPDKVKKRVAMMALDRAKQLALSSARKLESMGEKPSEKLLLEILKKWGKHIEFEEPEEKHTHEHHHTIDPWDVILSHVDKQRQEKESP